MGRIKITKDEIDKIIEMAEENETTLGDHMESSHDVSTWLFEKKQQILDDHEKARKVDDMYIRVGQLIQENTQLKEELSKEALSNSKNRDKIINLKQKLEKIKERWNLINVDLDAVEDCVKMCFFIKKEIILDSQESKK